MAPNLNVVVQNALSQHIVIRGVGTNEFFGNAPSSVGTYMDEVTMNSSYMSTLGLFDMERIEVLRGPQNSLFGRNTTGGAVNYISRMPQVGAESVDGDVVLTYGSHNLAEIEARHLVSARLHGGAARSPASSISATASGTTSTPTMTNTATRIGTRCARRWRSNPPKRRTSPSLHPHGAIERRSPAAEDGRSPRAAVDHQYRAAHQRPAAVRRQHRLGEWQCSTPSATRRRSTSRTSIVSRPAGRTSGTAARSAPTSRSMAAT